MCLRGKNEVLLLRNNIKIEGYEAYFYLVTKIIYNDQIIDQPNLFSPIVNYYHNYISIF